MIALLVCVSAAGCAKNGGEVQTVTCLAEPEVTYVSEPVSSYHEIGEVSGYFDYALLKETAGDENFVISPMSVKLALNMAAMGAEEETEKELLTLFGYENSEQMRENSKSLVSELDRADGSLTVNNSVWIDSDFQDISENYTGGLADVFNAVTFREKLADKKIVEKLNGWIDEKTNGLIPDMISEPFRDDTVMLLVNALYFKNKWDNEFEPNFNMVFHGVNGDSETESMTDEGKHIYYGEGSVFRSVRFYYKDDSYMNVYLPKSEDGDVLEIIGRLTPDELAKAMDILYSNGMETDRSVRVVMPKFECEYRESLKETLQKLGIFYSFEAGFASFDGMLIDNSEETLYISDVIHAAKLECNEKGTEAAAVTIEVFDGCAIEENPPIDFIVDKPFIYEIKAPSGETLFMGIICGF